MHSKTQDRLRALASDLEELADSMGNRNDGMLIVDAVRERTTTARIHASRAKNGPWYAYVSLAPGIRPRNPKGWIYQETGDAHYWFDKSGKTEDEAIRNAIKEFLDMEMP